MKVLVIGGDGFLGKKILSIFSKKGEKVTGTGHSKKAKNLIPLDITSRKRVFEVIEKVKPDVVINTAALTDVDWCETHEKECFKVNIDGVENIALACKKLECKMVQISTDYVFDGRKKTKYNEKDKPIPLNVYSKSKYKAEKVVQKNLENYLIIRTIVLYGFNDLEDKTTFVKWVLEKLKEGKEFKVVEDQVGCPTLIDDIAEALFVLIKKDRKGVYHASGSEYISRHNFAKKIAKAFGFNKRLVKPCLSSELKQKAKRAKYLNSDLGKIKKEGIKISSIDEGLIKMKKCMDEHNRY